MTKRLKVIGIRTMVPLAWGDVKGNNTLNRQRLIFMATTSRKKFLEEANRLGVKMTLGYLTNYGYSSMGGRSAEFALINPEILCWEPESNVHDFAFAGHLIEEIWFQ